MVERLLAELTSKRLRHGVFRSIVNLQANINRFLRDRNRNPKPFIWTKGADTIIRKHQRAKGGQDTSSLSDLARNFSWAWRSDRSGFR